MREYGKVFSRIWESATFRALSEDGRSLALYLLTCHHGTIAGAFRLPDGYACEDLQWSAERVAEGFANLFDNGFATRDFDTKWVWVHRYLEWNPPENPNQRKAVEKIAAMVPSECAWKRAFMRVCGGVDTSDGTPKQEPSPKGSETLPESGTGTGTGKNTLSDRRSPRTRKAGDLTEEQEPRFARFYGAYPRHEARADAEKAFAAVNPDDATVDAMVAAVKAQQLPERWADAERRKFVPMPASWLRGKRWTDEATPAQVFAFANKVAL